jgi:hypothetical protein
MPRARTAPPAEPARAPGFRRPTTTPVPDELFDEWLAVLSGAELKCLLYIVRRTLGFKKDADAISLSQMVNGITTRDGRVLDGGTGLNRSTVVAALASLEARGLIIVVRAADDQGAALTSTYALRWRDEAAAPPPAPPPAPIPPSPRRGRERAVALVPKTPPTTTVGVASQTAREVVGKLDQDRPGEVVGKSNQGGRKGVVGKSNQGSRKIRPGWLENPPEVVGESDSQQTDQETESNDDSNRAAPKFRKDTTTAPPYSPYIAGIVIDHSRELGDLTHGPANVTQALRLWQQSALAEDDFVACLHEARRRVHLYQGKQGLGGIQNRMAYYFRVVSDLARGEGATAAAL